MAKVIRLTESDLTRIVRKVIIENQKQNNNSYYSNRNLRRLGRTPVVMVESIDDYGPILMTEGILDTVKEKVMSLIDKSKSYFEEKAETMKSNVENYFGKDLEEITLDDVKNTIKDDLSQDTELAEEKSTKFQDMFDKADIGGKTGEVGWDRPFQKIMDILQQIFGVNVLSFGLLGSFLQSFFTAIPNSWLTHLIVSALAIVVITFIRKLVAILQGKKIKENYNRKKRRY